MHGFGKGPFNTIYFKWHERPINNNKTPHALPCINVISTLEHWNLDQGTQRCLGFFFNKALLFVSHLSFLTQNPISL